MENIIFYIGVVISFIGGLFFWGNSREKDGEHKANQEGKNQLLEDVQEKNEINEETREIISDGSRDDRINRL